MSEIKEPNQDKKALTMDELDSATGGSAIYYTDDCTKCPICGCTKLRVSLTDKTLRCNECGNIWPE